MRGEITHKDDKGNVKFKINAKEFKSFIKSASSLDWEGNIIVNKDGLNPVTKAEVVR